MFKVRFNLGRGDNYMKWQVLDTERNRQYYHPEAFVLLLVNARLHNQPQAAKKIHAGANKAVCAWITADNVVVYRRDEVPSSYLSTYGREELRLRYNPRVQPNWVNTQGENVDNNQYDTLVTIGKGVFQVL